MSKGFKDSSFKNTQNGFDATAWRKLLSSPDTLRQRMTLALSKIVVIAIDGLVGVLWKNPNSRIDELLPLRSVHCM